MRYYGSYGMYGMSQGTAIFTLIVSLGIAIFGIVCMWKVFEKADEPGWKVLIPIYNGYMLFKIAWSGGWFFVPILGSVITSLLASLGPRSPIVAILSALILIGVSVIAIVLEVKMARAFGKSGGFAVGLIFLPIIFYAILAFGDARYIGPDMSAEDAARYASNAGASGNAAENAGAQGRQSAAPRRTSGAFAAMTVIFVAILCLFGLLGAYLAVVNYKPARGLFGSPFVGLKNFAQVVDSPAFPMAMRNSLFLKVIQIIGGALFGTLLALWPVSASTPQKTLSRACVCLVPMCLPSIVGTMTAQTLLATGAPMTGVYQFALATVVQGAGFFGFCGGLFSYLQKIGHGGGTFQGILAAICVYGLSLLTPDMEAVYALQNNLNMTVMETADTYMYRVGLINAQFGVASAISVVKIGLQIAAAILPAVGIAIIGSHVSRASHSGLSEGGSASFSFGGGSAAACIFIALLLTALTAGGYILVRWVPTEAGGFSMDLDILGGALSSALIAVFGGVLAGLVAFCWAQCFRSGRKGHALAAMVAAASLSGLLVRYLLARTLAIVGTVIPVILRSVCDPRMVALFIILGLALRAVRGGHDGSLAVGLMLLGAAFAWGTYMGGMIYINNRSMFPLTTLLRQLGLNAAMFAGAEGGAASVNVMVLYRTILSVAVTLPALLLGGFGAMCLARGMWETETLTRG